MCIRDSVKTVGSDGCDHFYRHGEAGSRMADQILKRLKFDNDTIARVTKLVKWHDYAFNMTKANVRRAMNQMCIRDRYNVCRHYTIDTI